MRVALATAPGAAEISRDDEFLALALREQGAEPESVVWSEKGADWGQYGVVAVRTTWDYHLRLEEFLTWAASASQVTHLVNDPALYEWNAHKSYLLDLERKGVPIVPTQVVFSEAEIPLDRLPGAFVVKPEVGASALGAFRTAGMEAYEVLRRLHELLKNGGVLVQGYVPEIETFGELSLAWIDGEVRHAVRKTPAEGDFRIQVEHGGSNERVDVPPETFPLAEKIISCLNVVPTFARIDLVRFRDDWRLMELELIEPELMFEWAPESAAVLAAALMR